MADAIGADRTAVRLSPNGDSQGANDSDPFSLFPAAAAALSEIGIAFLELREPPLDGTFGKAEVDRVHPFIRKAFDGPLVLNSDFTLARAQAALDAGEADAIAFGRPFLANPDLVERLRRDAPLNPDDMATWYSQGPEGYIDYPALRRQPRRSGPSARASRARPSPPRRLCPSRPAGRGPAPAPRSRR